MSRAGAVGSPGGTHPLLVDGNNIHVAYWQGGNLQYQRSADGGANWSDAVPLTSGGTAQYPCSLERTRSTLHLIWPDSRHAGKWEVYYKRSRDGGQTWGHDVRLTSGEIYYKRSTDGGATWGPDIRMSHSSGHARHPQILAVANGRVCLIWEDGQVWEGGQKWSGDGAMYAAVSQDNGQTWAEPQRITFVNSPHGRATHAKSYAADRRIHLTWTDGLPGSNTAPIRAQVPYYTTSLDGGLTWQPAERLAEGQPGTWEAAAVAGTESNALELLAQSGVLYVLTRARAAVGPSHGLQGDR